MVHGRWQNPKTRLNRRGNDDRMRARPGQAQGGPLEGGKKDELLEQDTVRGWNRSGLSVQREGCAS